MLSWERRDHGPAKTKFKPGSGMSPVLRSHTARTSLGTALVHEREDGQAELDMWRPDQTSIGKGLFATVDAAKTRAETILDPRATAWEMLDDPLLLDDVRLDDTG